MLLLDSLDSLFFFLLLLFFKCDCQEAPALLWQQGMTVGLFWLGCGQSEASSAGMRARRDDKTFQVGVLSV